MDKMKFCKDCHLRLKGGYCPVVETFVPKKQTKNGKNIATTCDHFRTK